MQDELKRLPTLGATRDLICPRCTERNRRPMRRSHIYGERRSWREVERFWECIACGHKIPGNGDSPQ
jgi:hypothetical protein